MSTMALVQGPLGRNGERESQRDGEKVGWGVVGAWETDGQIYFASQKPGTASFSEPQAAPGDGRDRKHPSVAINARGELLLAWTEGTGWEKGGALAWQVFDSDGKPTSSKGRVEGGIPVWGLPAAVATDSGFVIVH